jgi:hypothetical protein
MDMKFPYGYDVNAYIDKAFEQMKADFPWATRDMIAEHTRYGIEKVGGDYQYVAYWNNDKGKREAFPQKTDCEGFLKSLVEGHEWELEHANPVKEYINVPATCTYSCDWYLDKYLDLVSPGSFYVGRKDMENCPGLKEFMGF